MRRHLTSGQPFSGVADPPAHLLLPGWGLHPPSASFCNNPPPPTHTPYTQPLRPPTARPAQPCKAWVGPRPGSGGPLPGLETEWPVGVMSVVQSAAAAGTDMGISRKPPTIHCPASPQIPHLAAGYLLLWREGVQKEGRCCPGRCPCRNVAGLVHQGRWGMETRVGRKWREQARTPHHKAPKASQKTEPA